MPAGAYRECRAPLCPNYASDRTGYCQEHRQNAAQRPAFIHAVARLQTCARFRRLRHSFLVRHPVCNICHREPATELDHIVPHRGILGLFWDQRNWQGACATCHGRKTQRETLAQ